jgi:hypothetical protein
LYNITNSEKFNLDKEKAKMKMQWLRYLEFVFGGIVLGLFLPKIIPSEILITGICLLGPTLLAVHVVGQMRHDKKAGEERQVLDYNDLIAARCAGMEAMSRLPLADEKD